jgi:23S rRNA (uracil1939-C5)-methyltransferase
MKSPSPSALIQLQMEKPVYGGDCLSHLPASGGKPGKAAFVPLTLPGETVTGQITDNKRSFLKAELDQILTPSPSRIAPACAHFGACGGCQYQHADYPTQSEMKQQILRETLSRAGVLIPSEIASLAGEPWAYRNRIRLATTPTGGVAYRGRSSHDLIPIRECPIAAPLLTEIALDLSRILDPKDPRNDLAEIEFFTNHDSSEVLVTFHTHSGNPTYGKLSFTPREGSPRPRADLDDQPFLTYRVSGHDFRVTHGAFFQINRHLLDDFAKLVTANHYGSVAWDLYAGVGLFARHLAQSFSRVVAVESAPASREALVHNLASTSSEPIPATTLDYLRRNREQREPRPDCIVLDPPRAGLGDEVTTLLNAIGAPRLTYVSCDPTTLARDLRALTLERYRIGKITLVDMFPQTFHIETVVELHRS